MQHRQIAVLALVLSVIANVVARADQIDDFVKAELVRQRIPGLALVVIKDGAIVKAAGYGVADRTLQTPVTPQTMFNAGSIGKTFVATAIMLLIGDGQLRLDAPIGEFLDGMPATWNGITVRHLLTHTSGLVRGAPGYDPNKTQTEAEVIRSAYSLPLRFAPGEKWEYSNLGYWALAEIVNKVTRRPWIEYVSAKVLRPAGMTQTVSTNMANRVTNAARGYTDNDNLRDAPNFVAVNPAGGFLSTVLDLAKWDAVLSAGTILSEAVLRQMWTPVTLNDGRSHPYGLGWELEPLRGRRQVHHGGGTAGFLSEFVRLPDDRLTIIVLINLDDADLNSIVPGIAARYLPASAPPGSR